jgi:hypothetical protein
LKIREIHVYAYDLPVKNPPRVMSSGTLWSLDTTPDRDRFGAPVASF